MIYYLEAVFDAQTERLLMEQRIKLGLAGAALPKRGFHATIAYSTSPFHYVIKKFPEKAVANAAAFGLFGSSLVVTLTSPWLVKQHELVVDDGATWDFPAYVPHVTIAEEQTKNPPAYYANLLPIPFTLRGIQYHQFDKEVRT